MKRNFNVNFEEKGQRLDIWLTRKLSGTSRKEVKRALDTGRVTVNGKRISIAGWKLNAKDKVEVRIGEENERKNSFVRILYEDKDLIVVDKPAGIISVSEQKIKESMFKLVRGYLRRKYNKNSYLYPLHRLDAETSGTLVFAKSKAGERLEAQFKKHVIGREYIAIVSGNVKRDSGRIRAPLEKGEFGEGKKVRAAKGGKDAITEYLVEERYKNATLLRVRVLTGRTHQIRVHLADIGHPLLGDKVYGSVIEEEEEISKRVSIKRQALHARYLSFRHPASGKKIRVESKPPKDISKLIEKLRGIDN